MKKEIKKLTMGKMTISNLTASEMNQKFGGSGSRASNCPTTHNLLTIKK